MPHYKAYVTLNATQSGAKDTITITLEANNAIEAKALLQDRYGEGAVQSIKRQDQAYLSAGQAKATSPKTADAATPNITNTESHKRIKARA